MIKLQQLIQELKLTDDMRIHMSRDPFELEKRVYEQRISDMKPRGFWYGFGSEWIDWTRSEMPEWTGKYIYKVDIGNSNVLKLSNQMELAMFDRQYEASRDGGIFKDWVAVSKKYDGIEINPYQWSSRRNYIWYYGWDVASGCVWNLTDIKLTLISDRGIE